MDVSFLRKINRRVRLMGQIPYLDGLKKIATILSIKPYTMVNYPRLAKGYDLMLEAERFSDLEGAIVECGAWNGGYGAMMNKVSESENKEREVWLFDSFEGLPPPTAEDVTFRGKTGIEGSALGARAMVDKAFEDVDAGRVHVVTGWFEDTFDRVIPHIGKIAFLHLDADFYESTKYCLEKLYPLLSPGGYIIIDDYAYYLGCKKAVDEFLEEKGLLGGLVQTVEHSAYFKKPTR